MIRAVKIWLNRAEGPSAHLGQVEFTGEDVWALAGAQLLTWSATAPGAPRQLDLGYDKTDFKVTYEDGFEYEGRLDLTYREHNLPRHIRESVDYLIEHPEVAAQVEVDVEDARRFLAEYEIGAQS